MVLEIDCKISVWWIMHWKASRRWQKTRSCVGLRKTSGSRNNVGLMTQIALSESNRNRYCPFSIVLSHVRATYFNYHSIILRLFVYSISTLCRFIIRSAGKSSIILLIVSCCLCSCRVAFFFTFQVIVWCFRDLLKFLNETLPLRELQNIVGN